MRKYGVLLLVLVLAATSLLAAAAYNTATVTNAASLYVNTTSWALLALQPYGTGSNVGNKDLTARVENGVLVFEFGRSERGHPSEPHPHPGLQKDSVYKWTPLFRALNLSAEDLDVTLSVTGPFANRIAFASNWTGQVGDYSATGGTYTFGGLGASLTLTNVAPNARPWFGVMVDLTGYTGTVDEDELPDIVLTGSILVTGVAR